MSLMINFQMLLTGFGLGVLISAPVGPVNIMCIQRTLARGFWAGFAVGIGAICADFIISAMAAFGISALSTFIQDYETQIQFIGALILIGFGVKIFRVHPKLLSPYEGVPQIRGHLGAIPQSFLLTITNPGAILGIFAVFGSVGTAIGGLRSYSDSAVVLLGLLAGATLWWLGLARIISSFREKMTENRLEKINQIAGMILVVCGVALLGHVYVH